MRRRALLLASAALAATGCGSDSASSAPEKPARTDAPKQQASAAASAKDTIEDFTFTPETVTVKAGGTVTWTDKDSANHTVTFDDKSVKGIGNLRQGQKGSVSFPRAGTYSYVCTYHPGMEGKVVVK